MSLDHINLWLLEDDDGWTVVDTCLNLASARDTWEQLFSGFMQGKPIKRVICTHLHPDHVGMATGEAMAHLNCLLGRRRITRSRDAEGVYWYQQIAATAQIDD
jgi:glyoxylase-like metal-dependent hydrolase (beta-lactamase superfamily II)